ncbi:MAG: amidohydrolase family protein [Thermoleophilia bacterium]|nr:amidohydrolase family protein [Thermoleophilia bacterium]
MALGVLALTGCGGSELRGDVLIRADRVFDGERTIEPGALLLRGGEIAAVGEELDAQAERTFDLGDATVLPGFIDLHTHVNDPVMLRGGVTTVRNLGWPLAALRPPGRYGGLRVLMAGPIVTVPDGYPIPAWAPEIALPVRGAADARRAVRILVGRGAAVVKIALEPRFGPMLDLAEIRAIVDEAHRHDRLVTAHVSGHGGTILAVEAGVDELAHMPCGSIGDAVLRSVVEAGIEVVATLDTIKGYGTICGDPVRDAARFVELGGTLLYGSDVPNVRVTGIDAEELRLLREAGLTPEAVLSAGTSRAGEQVGLDPLGTLTAGAPADVIAVRGDARALRDDLARPLLVVAGGRIVRAPRG